ncbi:MAG: S8 family serine peptidase [Verrucomicrobia subdivision 3 bacterium]|nr:S8 family serine peptidase [Limisphaerales bacterium]
MLAALAPAAAATHKLRVKDPTLAQELLQNGGKLVADYGSFQVIETDQPNQAEGRTDRTQLADASDHLELNTGRLDTRSPLVKSLRKTRGAFPGRRLHLVQFAGPVKPEWRGVLERSGARVMSYVPNNAYLLYGDAKALAQIQAWAGVTSIVQWEGDYAESYKIHPAARLTDANGFPQTPTADLFAVQLVDDSQANPNTVALIEQWKLAPVRREFRVLQYHNFIVRLQPEHLPEIASQPDVISISPYEEAQMHDERQDQIIAGNLSGPAPSGPGYLAWLAGKGFTQEQFTATGFVVDLTDSGIDNGTVTPGHLGLNVAGNPAQGSRVVYNRVEGTPHAGSTTAGYDGHGNLNAHILGGFNDAAGGFPHADAAGFRYGLGVCPFVKLGSSVVFDPDTFTSPNYANLQSRAYQDGARISANSWGMTNNSYTVDAQAYDALVRDAQPDGSAFAAPGNQEMVIVFAAGNRGTNLNTVGAPGTAKNVITVGAAENVRSSTVANGGNSSFGNDGCGYSDANSDSASDLASFSSHGPCSDGRQKPDLVAPGSHITGGVAQSVSATNGTGMALAGFRASSICALNGAGVAGSTNNFFPLGQQFYTVSSGTSHATPAVAGACALVRQYFINQNLTAPSPAMTKAFLMNSTRYLTGQRANDSLWSSGQGMGALNLGTAFDGVVRVLRDQKPVDKLTASGQTRVFTGTISDTNKPVRVTLAWTDAPGNTFGNAFNNDLDLSITVGGNTYKGNVFGGAFSITGGNADARNNVESVFLPAGSTGNVAVTITAANINSDGVPNEAPTLDQDFALVIYNVSSTQTPILSPGGFSLLTEGCFPMNGAVDPGETVTMNFSLKNTGTAATSNLVATLLATNGVVQPSGAQLYGLVPADGGVVSRPFTFTTSGACGSTITPVWRLQEGTNNLGNVTQTLPLGLITVPTLAMTNAAPITIPDVGKASIYPSPIAVSGVSGIVNKVTVTLLGYSHTWPDDVDVLLVGPTGQKVLLMSDCGGGNVLNGVTLTFDSEAVASVADNAVIPSGHYKPTNFDTTSDNFPAPAPSGPFGGSLAAFNGLDPNGNWSLYVQDDGSLDAGSIAQGWALSLTVSNLACCDGALNLADLGIAQIVMPPALYLGSNVTIILTITNHGPDPAGFVTVTNLLPPALTFVSAVSAQGDCTNLGAEVSCALGHLNPGATASVTLHAIPASAGVFTNLAFVRSVTADSSAANNVSAETLYVGSEPPGSGIITNFITHPVTSNAAPVLAPVPDRIIHAGTLLLITNVASDADGLANALTFSLDRGAPGAASVGAADGIFMWPSTDADANTTNQITVRVTDTGMPPLSKARSFLVSVVPRPLLTGITVSNQIVNVAWTALPGQAYRLQFTRNLTTTNWTAVVPDVTAEGATATHTNAFDPATINFYRVQLVP